MFDDHLSESEASVCLPCGRVIEAFACGGKLSPEESEWVIQHAGSGAIVAAGGVASPAPPTQHPPPIQPAASAEAEVGQGGMEESCARAVRARFTACDPAHWSATTQRAAAGSQGEDEEDDDDEAEEEDDQGEAAVGADAGSSVGDETEEEEDCEQYTVVMSDAFGDG